MDDAFYTHIDIYRYSIIDLTYMLFHQIYIYFRMKYALLMFSNHLFIPVIMLKTLRFESSVLFGIHTLLDKSVRVLQLPTHLSNLTENG